MDIIFYLFICIGTLYSVISYWSLCSDIKRYKDNIWEKATGRIQTQIDVVNTFRISSLDTLTVVLSSAYLHSIDFFKYAVMGAAVNVIVRRAIWVAIVCDPKKHRITDASVLLKLRG